MNGGDGVELGCLPGLENVAEMGAGSKVVTGLWEALVFCFRRWRASGRRSLERDVWERKGLRVRIGLESGRRVWFWRED